MAVYTDNHQQTSISSLPASKPEKKPSSWLSCLTLTFPKPSLMPTEPVSCFTWTLTVTGSRLISIDWIDGHSCLIEKLKPDSWDVAPGSVLMFNGYLKGPVLRSGVRVMQGEAEFWLCSSSASDWMDSVCPSEHSERLSSSSTVSR